MPWLNAAILSTPAEWNRQDVRERDKGGKKTEREREKEGRWNNNKVKEGGRREDR